MAGRFLIDLTDERFRVPENAAVMEFIRCVNPFAHTDVGSILFRLGKSIGAPAYCPDVRSCAYVVLHTAANRIFAIAFGQRAIALLIAPGAQSDAIAEGAVPAPEVGPDWMHFEPWVRPPAIGENPRVQRWAWRSFVDASADFPAIFRACPEAK